MNTLALALFLLLTSSVDLSTWSPTSVISTIKHECLDVTSLSRVQSNISELTSELVLRKFIVEIP